MAARKPRAGWRNRNYLAGLSEATEEKGLVARVSCGRRLKYRKFKHRSTPARVSPTLAAAPALDLHFVYRFFWLCRSFSISSLSLFPSQPEAARDRPDSSASGRQTSPSTQALFPPRDCSSARLHRGSSKTPLPPLPRTVKERPRNSAFRRINLQFSPGYPEPWEQLPGLR